MKIANEKLVRNLGIDENFIISSCCCSLELDTNEELDDAEPEQPASEAGSPSADVTIEATAARGE